MLCACPCIVSVYSRQVILAETFERVRVNEKKRKENERSRQDNWPEIEGQKRLLLLGVAE